MITGKIRLEVTVFTGADAVPFLKDTGSLLNYLAESLVGQWDVGVLVNQDSPPEELKNGETSENSGKGPK